MTDFQEHIRRIKLARKRAAEILSIWSPSEDATIASLACAWERLFDTLCNDDEISISDLNTITGVIQKLSAIHDTIKQNKDGSCHALSPEEIIRHAEEQLKLL